MKKNLLALSSYQFDLPSDLIAQVPVSPRDSSRLMIVNREKGTLEEIVFRDLLSFLNKEDTLIFNDTKVLPARLIGKRKDGGTGELLLTQPHSDGTWDALVRPGKKFQDGAFLEIGPGFAAEILSIYPDGLRRVKFHLKENLETLLNRYGQIPLPPYIRSSGSQAVDASHYQTVYAKSLGAIAAPTAGLHFTNELLQAIEKKGLKTTTVTLHVGIGTFRPVQTEDILEHKMHLEKFIITPEAAEQLTAQKKGKQICVGTTSCRAIEASVNTFGKITPGSYDTSIFIYPGYSFKYVQHLLTNFHLPGSTLLMLVSAFAGYELIQEAYAKAIEKRFRFFSYGDAMLII